MINNNNKGFSLIELLVALSILAVVAAIIVPRFLNVRQQATQTAALQNLRQLQSTAQQFLALGGSMPAGATAGDVLNYLSGNAGVRATSTTAGTAIGGVVDSGGTMGSYTIAWNPTPSTLTMPTAAATPVGGFHVSAITAGSTAWYSDGNGSYWGILLDTAGNLTAAPGTGSVNQTQYSAANGNL